MVAYPDTLLNLDVFIFLTDEKKTRLYTTQAHKAKFYNSHSTQPFIENILDTKVEMKYPPSR